jgi:hypothetical protein
VNEEGVMKLFSQRLPFACFACALALVLVALANS